MLCPCMLSDEYISSDLRARNDAKIDIYFGFMFQPTPNNTRETRTDLLSKPQNYYFFSEKWRSRISITLEYLTEKLTLTYIKISDKKTCT